MENPFSLNNKTIMVTGASSGIGRQAALDISAAGGRLIITGRNEERLAATFSQLSGTGHHYVSGDLLNKEFLEALAENSPELQGLVHCAGIMRPVPIRFIEQQDVDAMFGLNYHVPVMLTVRLLKRKRITGNASVVFMTSISGAHKPWYGGALYAGSKAALESFSKTLALEYAPKKIRSNCIAAAMVETPMSNELMGGAGPAELEAYEKKYPLGFGKPADVAAALIYLLSDASRWVTGTTLLLDGGHLLNT